MIGNLADLPELRKEYGLLVVGIGSNQFQAQVYEKAKALGFAFPNIVAPSAYISPYSKMGYGCVVLQNACIQNGASVGNSVLLNDDLQRSLQSEPPGHLLRAGVREEYWLSIGELYGTQF